MSMLKIPLVYVDVPSMQYAIVFTYGDLGISSERQEGLCMGNPINSVKCFRI